MNKARRKQLSEIAELLQELNERVELLRDEEQDAFDSLPESLQQGERGQGMELAVEKMDAAIESIGESITALEEAQV